jgi:hypothetical protein
MLFGTKKQSIFYLVRSQLAAFINYQLIFMPSLCGSKFYEPVAMFMVDPQRGIEISEDDEDDEASGDGLGGG